MGVGLDGSWQEDDKIPTCHKCGELLSKHYYPVGWNCDKCNPNSDKWTKPWYDDWTDVLT